MMKKYTTEKEEPLGPPIPVRFKVGTMEGVDQIHGNRQEFIRDSVEKNIAEQLAAIALSKRGTPCNHMNNE